MTEQTPEQRRPWLVVDLSEDTVWRKFDWGTVDAVSEEEAIAKAQQENDPTDVGTYGEYEIECISTVAVPLVNDDGSPAYASDSKAEDAAYELANQRVGAMLDKRQSAKVILHVGRQIAEILEYIHRDVPTEYGVPEDDTPLAIVLDKIDKALTAALVTTTKVDVIPQPLVIRQHDCSHSVVGPLPVGVSHVVLHDYDLGSDIHRGKNDGDAEVKFDDDGLPYVEIDVEVSDGE